IGPCWAACNVTPLGASPPRGLPMEAICEAASWTVPGIFARFYRVNVATPHPLPGILEHPPSVSR
ncbi:hypothetical protein XENOCAPTIV_001231, partial [Xenoophorus captivus]